MGARLLDSQTAPSVWARQWGHGDQWLSCSIGPVHLISSSIVQGSGSAAIDGEMPALFQRAQPLPAPPADFNGIKWFCQTGLNCRTLHCQWSARALKNPVPTITCQI